MAEKEQHKKHVLKHDYTELYVVLIVLAVAIIGVVFMISNAGITMQQPQQEEPLAAQAGGGVLQCASQHICLSTTFIQFKNAKKVFDDNAKMYDQYCGYYTVAGVTYQKKHPTGQQNCDRYKSQMDDYSKIMNDLLVQNKDCLNELKSECPSEMEQVSEFDIKSLSGSLETQKIQTKSYRNEDYASGNVILIAAPNDIIESEKTAEPAAEETDQNSIVQDYIE